MIEVGPYQIELEPWEHLPPSAFDRWFSARPETDEPNAVDQALMDRHLFKDINVKKEGKSVTVDDNMPYTVAMVIVREARPYRQEVLDLGKYLASSTDTSGTE